MEVTTSHPKCPWPEPQNKHTKTSSKMLFLANSTWFGYGEAVNFKKTSFMLLWMRRALWFGMIWCSPVLCTLRLLKFWRIFKGKWEIMWGESDTIHRWLCGMGTIKCGSGGRSGVGKAAYHRHKNKSLKICTATYSEKYCQKLFSNSILRYSTGRLLLRFHQTAYHRSAQETYIFGGFGEEALISNNTKVT